MLIKAKIKDVIDKLTTTYSNFSYQIVQNKIADIFKQLKKFSEKNIYSIQTFPPFDKST